MVGLGCIVFDFGYLLVLGEVYFWGFYGGEFGFGFLIFRFRRVFWCGGFWF